MAKTILVALNAVTRIAALLRHLEKIAKPGNRVVFLVGYQGDVSSWLLAQLTQVQTGFEQGVACEERKAGLTWDEQQARWEKDLAEPARRALGRTGVEVDVDLYCGSLNQAVKRYLENGDVARIVVGTSSWLGRLKTAPTVVRHWFVRTGLNNGLFDVSK